MSPPIDGLDLPLSAVTPASGALLAPLAEPRLGARASEGVDLILEGFLLHHGSPARATSPEPDERLLAGDYCYATGLVQVAETGDLGAIRALSRLIAISSAVVADGLREVLPGLWRHTAAALGADDGAREQLAELMDRIAAGETTDLQTDDDAVGHRLREAFV